jgi:hypothetical protein
MSDFDKMDLMITKYEEDNMSDFDKIELMITNLITTLKELAEQVRADIPEEQGSKHLWTAVEDAEILLSEIEEEGE